MVWKRWTHEAQRIYREPDEKMIRACPACGTPMTATDLIEVCEVCGWTVEEPASGATTPPTDVKRIVMFDEDRQPRTHWAHMRLLGVGETWVGLCGLTEDLEAGVGEERQADAWRLGLCSTCGERYTMAWANAKERYLPSDGSVER